MKNKYKVTDKEALDFHELPKPGKFDICPSKPMITQRDLALAYSPGVAVPVKKIFQNKDASYDYTNRGNLVAVITNGTAILGMGNLGAAASKPVMEGKAVLFKRFADLNSIDLEIDTSDPEEFINAVKYLGPSFGGINLEDIKAPESFIIEETLKECMDIPVFHDDQHGTAIITAAALINALDISGKSIKDIKIAVSGAGSAALAVISLIKAMGLPSDHAILCDSKGVLYKGRPDINDQFQTAHVVDTKLRTLKQVMKDADVLIGLSIAGAVSQEMIKSMAKNPIIFAMANPDPEITPEEILEVRKDAIIATGRSDYPNQVNNVLGFPYIFRGALDVRARTINEEMKIACAKALADLAREDVPDEVAVAYGSSLQYGTGYIIPTPFDPRLISKIPPAVAKAAMDSGVAGKPIKNLKAYEQSLAARLDPSATLIHNISNIIKSSTAKKIVFAEGEEPSVIRAAHHFQLEGHGKAILIGRKDEIKQRLKELGLGNIDGKEPFIIENARLSDNRVVYRDFLYQKLQRKGFLERDVQRLVHTDRNVYGACMLAMGHADGMVTGVTRHYNVALSNICLALDTKPDERLSAITIILSSGKVIFIADTNINQNPNAEHLADIATQTAHAVKHLGFEPKVAFVCQSNFGNPDNEKARIMRKAVELLDSRQNIDFQYDGGMSPRTALNAEIQKLYPFSRLNGPANVLIVPDLESGNISAKLLQEVSKATVIGPLLLGLEKPVQICQTNASVTEISRLAAIAAYDLDKAHRSWVKN